VLIMAGHPRDGWQGQNAKKGSDHGLKSSGIKHYADGGRVSHYADGGEMTNPFKDDGGAQMVWAAHQDNENRKQDWRQNEPAEAAPIQSSPGQADQDLASMKAATPAAPATSGTAATEDRGFTPSAAAGAQAGAEAAVAAKRRDKIQQKAADMGGYGEQFADSRDIRARMAKDKAKDAAPAKAADAAPATPAKTDAEPSGTFGRFGNKLDKGLANFQATSDKNADIVKAAQQKNAAARSDPEQPSLSADLGKVAKRVGDVVGKAKASFASFKETSDKNADIVKKQQKENARKRGESED
jgi:hypothetical protein